MARISNTLLTSITNLSENCRNPERALEVMKHTMTKTLKHIHARYIMDLFRTLIKQKIGNKKTEDLSKRICTDIPERNRTLVNIIMKWRYNDAQAKYRKERHEYMKYWRKEKTIIIQENIALEFDQIWSRECSKYAKNLRNKRQMKLESLKEKYKPKEIIIPDIVSGIVIKDKELPESFSSIPRCYGGIELNENENNILSLPPKFAVHEKVNTEEASVAIEKGMSKLRWEITKQSNTHMNINNSKHYYDFTNKTFDFRHMRATDLPFNKRVHLPPPMNERSEIEAQALKTEMIEATEEYIKEHNEIWTNLSKNQKAGLKSLLKKVKENNIIIQQTDKSKRFSVDTPENYRDASKEHVDKDKTIQKEEYDKMVKEINAHAIFWVRMTKARIYKNNTDRIKRNMTSEDPTVAP